LREGFFWGKWDIPETVGVISFADNDGFAVLVNLDVVFCE
jgi:hypothetical protein